MKIYVASSWRNPHQPAVVVALREAGHEIYDFRHPALDNDGFHWSEIDPNWENWTTAEYFEALKHPLAERGYGFDIKAMEWAEACVLVLPCGRSAHLELGWMAGRKKLTAILHPPTDPIEPELMAKMCDGQFSTIAEVIEFLA